MQAGKYVFYTVLVFFLAFAVGAFVAYNVSDFRMPNLSFRIPTPAPQRTDTAEVSPLAEPPQVEEVQTEESQGIGGVLLPATVIMNGQNNFPISGTAAVQDVEGRAVVTLALNGTTAGTRHAAAIYIGTCETLDTVLYQLEPVINGRSITTLSVSQDTLMDQRPVVINVQGPATTALENVSCGTIPDIRL